MFKDCSSLSSIYVGGFDTSKVTTMKEMFMNCSKITSLNIRSFNMSKVTNMESLFSGCKKLNSLTVSKTFHPKQAAQTTDIQSGMYKDCPMKIVIS
jgi:bacterial surface protein 26-residue repeat